FPDRVALVSADREVTYEELNRRANRVARYLSARGAGREVPIGICMERSIELVVGILGILKTGAAYLPLDPSYPTDRLRMTIDDASAPLVFTQRSFLERFYGHVRQTVCINCDWDRIAQCDDNDLEPATSADSVAYVIYTSGSAGAPKGVMGC